MFKDIIKVPQSKALKFNSWVRVGLLGGFLALAALMYFLDQYGVHLGYVSKNSSTSIFLSLVFCAAAVFEFAVLVVHVMVRLRQGAVGDTTMLTSFMRVVLILGVLVLVLYSTGTLSDIGKALGAFVGLLLGWSLQAPVSGMAAWALVSIKRPFRVGDRVLFPSLGLSGDVLDVGFMYTKLDQVGGSIGSEEAIGRYILIPNAMLFSQVAINYTPRAHAAYFLDEVVIRLTFDSDWEMAEKILLEAATEVTADIIRETGKKPYIRSDIYDYGVYMRLRFMTIATDRPRVSHEIIKRIFREVQKNPEVDFAIPYVYSYRKGVEAGPRTLGGPEPVTEVDVDNIDDPKSAEPLSAESEKSLRDLAQRISKMGLLQPIVVRRTEGGRYAVVAGRNRLLACKLLGWKDIPAVIKTGPMESPEYVEP